MLFRQEFHQRYLFMESQLQQQPVFMQDYPQYSVQDFQVFHPSMQ